MTDSQIIYTAAARNLAGRHNHLARTALARLARAGDPSSIFDTKEKVFADLMDEIRITNPGNVRCLDGHAARNLCKEVD